MGFVNEELYWAAGFFDGEGYTGVTKNHPSIKITQSHDDAVLKRFQAAFNGLGKIHVTYDKRHINPKTGLPPAVNYKWDVSSIPECRLILEKLLPLVSPIKARQIEIVLKAIGDRTGYSHTKERCTSGVG